MPQVQFFKVISFLSFVVFSGCYSTVKAENFSRKEQCTSLSRDYVHEVLKEVRKSQPKIATVPNPSSFLHIFPIVGNLTPVSVSTRNLSVSGGVMFPYCFLQLGTEVKDPLCPSKQEEDTLDIIDSGFHINFILGNLYRSPLYARFAYGTLPFGRHDSEIFVPHDMVTTSLLGGKGFFC